MATTQLPQHPAYRMSSGKDILSRMLQMEKQSRVSLRFQKRQAYTTSSEHNHVNMNLAPAILFGKPTLFRFS